MTDCIKIEDFMDLLKNIAEAVEIDQLGDRETRVNVWEITDDTVDTMVDSLEVPNQVFDASGHTARKLANDLNIPAEHQKSVGNLVTRIKENSTLGDSDASAMRSQMVALKEVLSAVKGEVDKAGNNNVDLGVISPDGVPNVPMSRVAAMVGRKVMYQAGYRATSLGEDGKAAQAEHMYYLVGEKILESLEAGGFVKLNPANSGQATLVDYIKGDQPKVNRDKPTTTGVSSITLLPSSLKVSKGKDSTDMDVLLGRSSEADESVFGSFRKVIDAVHRVTVPEKITFPTIGAENQSNKVRHQQNAYKPSKELKDTVKEVEDKPLYLNNDIHSLFGNIAKEVEGTGLSASSWIRRNLTDSSVLAGLFNVEKSTDVVADSASHVGRTISKTTPIDDIVEHFDKFKDNPALFFTMFLGRNARAYVEASVMNPQTSKSVRYGLEVDPYRVKVGSDDYKFYVDKVARAVFKKDKDGSVPTATLLAENMTGLAMGKETLAALKAYDQYTAATDANSQLVALAKMQKSGLKAENFSELLSTVKAIKGIRDSLGSDSLESNYMVSSDATGSGGLLTMLQALGSSQSENVTEVLKSLGVFKSNGDQEIEKVEDIYGILTRSLVPFLNEDPDEDSNHELSISSDYDADTVKRTLSAIKDDLFDGNFRDLAKSPTMTFIYDQSETGAIDSMSKAFTERLVERIRKKGPVTNDIRALLNDILPEDVANQADIDVLKSDPDLDTRLRKGFENSGVPGFLYDALSTTITNKYLSNHKNLASRVFGVAKKYVGDPNFRVMPAAWVAERAKKGGTVEPTLEELKQHGIPMTKLYDVARTMDNNDVVLTREERFAKTVMNTSFIHSADTASLFGGIAGLPTKHSTGAVLVHDDIRSNPMLVRENDKRYVEATRDVAYNYDIQEQVLLAANAYAGGTKRGSLNGISEYTEVLGKVRKNKAIKQKLIEENFDAESDSVIGDGAGFRSLEGPNKKAAESKSKGPGTVQSTATKKGRTPAKDVSVSDVAVRGVLEKLSGQSPIIAGFLKDSNKATVAMGDKDSFRSSDDTITLASGASSDIEHEIVHSYTAGLIQKAHNAERDAGFIEEFELVNGTGQFNQTVRDLRYAEKALQNIDLDKLSGMAKDRINYARNQPDARAALGEFISIMSTEPGVARAVYKQFGTGSTLKAVIKRVVDKIYEIIKSPTAKDLAAPVDSELLYSSISNIVNEGKSFRELNAEENAQLQKEFGQELFAGSRAGAYIDKSRDYFELLNSSVARTINDPALRKAWSLGSALDFTLSQRFPIYTRATNYLKGVYDDSEALKSLVHKITNDNINNDTKNEVLSTFSRIRAERNDLTSRELQKFKRVTGKMSADEMGAYRDFTQKMAIQDYFKFVEKEGVADIDNQIAELKAGLKGRAAKLDTIVDMNVKDKVANNTFYNINQIAGSVGPDQEKARAYVALRSIREMGVDRFNKFLENKELVTLVKDTVLANEALMFDAGIDTARVRDNKLAENFETPIMKRAVKPEDMKFMPQYKKDGWKRVSKDQTDGGLVILYKSEIDQTFQEGVFTDIRTQSADIPVDESFKGYENVVKTEDGTYQLVLTQAQRDEMGASTDPSQSLVRTMAHNMTLKESSIIRDKLLEKETYWELSANNAADLARLTKDKSRDNPWFLGSSDSLDLDQYPELAKHYTPVTKRLSDHNNFDEKIQFVRKDIGYWLIGANEKSLARDSKAQWAIRITKNLVSGMKIGMIALNPMKIFNDNLSNLTYLGVRGVDPIFMQKHYREISHQFNQYQGLRDKVIGLKVKSYADPKTYKGQIEKLEKELRDHPANGLIERGFLNSLGSELVMNADDPSSGFKSDIDTVLKKVFQDNEGKNNSIGRLLMKAANWNVGMEELLETVSPVFGSLDSTREVEASLNDIAERWKNIKSEEDAVAYMHQYMNSPDSEFVKLGTHMTDLTDVMAKETLYRHLVSNGMDAKKAELEVIDSFPDYKEAMPKRVRQLSDVGILMFPSYWLRIQKAIYRMVKDRPVSFGAETIAQEMMGMDGPTIMDSNILTKFNSHLGIFHNPLDNMGASNIVPTHII